MFYSDQHLEEDGDRAAEAASRHASQRKFKEFIRSYGEVKGPFPYRCVTLYPFLLLFLSFWRPSSVHIVLHPVGVFFLVQFRHLSMVNPISPHCSSPRGCLCLLQFIHSNLVTLISPHCSSSPCRCLCLVQFTHLNLVKEPRPSVSLQPGIGWIGCVGYFIAFRSWSQCCIDVLLRLVYVGTKL